MATYIRDLVLGETVKVYRNLRNKCWSVKDMKGRVIAHVEDIQLDNVSWHVPAGGSAKAKREKQRNVHAYAKGQVTDKMSCDSPNEGSVFVQVWRVIYNPFVHHSFVMAEDKNILVTKTDHARFYANGDCYGTWYTIVEEAKWQDL